MFVLSAQEKKLVLFLAGVVTVGGVVDFGLKKFPAWTARTAFLEEISRPKKYDLNTVTFAELDALPAVGRTTAERIVRYRQESGGFKNVEELKNVPGIGEKLYTQIAGFLIALPEVNDD